MNITFENKKEILEQLPKPLTVKFAIYTARLVSNLNTDPRAESAIKAAETWIKDPSGVNKRAATNAAYAAANAAANANAAYATNAAYAAYAAYAAANAAAANANAAAAAYAAYAAYIAYVAANAANNLKEIEQHLVQYLKELYLESLPVEERNSWLVQAAIGV